MANLDAEAVDKLHEKIRAENTALVREVTTAIGNLAKIQTELEAAKQKYNHPILSFLREKISYISVGIVSIAVIVVSFAVKSIDIKIGDWFIQRPGHCIANESQGSTDKK